MASRVLKYHIGGVLPEHHKFLHAGVQNGEHFLWLEVDPQPDDKFIESPYVICGTGRTVPVGAAHKITFFDGPFVWHVYDKRGRLAFLNKGDNEETFAASMDDPCLACGGSGHADDARGA